MYTEYINFISFYLLFTDQPEEAVELLLSYGLVDIATTVARTTATDSVIGRCLLIKSRLVISIPVTPYIY